MAKKDLTSQQCLKIIRAKGVEGYVTIDLQSHLGGTTDWNIYITSERGKPSFFNGKTLAQAMKEVDKVYA